MLHPKTPAPLPRVGYSVENKDDSRSVLLNTVKKVLNLTQRDIFLDMEIRFRHSDAFTTHVVSSVTLVKGPQENSVEQKAEKTTKTGKTKKKEKKRKADAMKRTVEPPLKGVLRAIPTGEVYVVNNWKAVKRGQLVEEEPAVHEAGDRDDATANDALSWETSSQKTERSSFLERIDQPVSSLENEQSKEAEEVNVVKKRSLSQEEVQVVEEKKEILKAVKLKPEVTEELKPVEQPVAEKKEVLTEESKVVEEKKEILKVVESLVKDEKEEEPKSEYTNLPVDKKEPPKAEPKPAVPPRETKPRREIQLVQSGSNGGMMVSQYVDTKEAQKDEVKPVAELKKEVASQSVAAAEKKEESPKSVEPPMEVKKKESLSVKKKQEEVNEEKKEKQSRPPPVETQPKEEAELVRESKKKEVKIEEQKEPAKKTEVVEENKMEVASKETQTHVVHAAGWLEKRKGVKGKTAVFLTVRAPIGSSR